VPVQVLGSDLRLADGNRVQRHARILIHSSEIGDRHRMLSSHVYRMLSTGYSSRGC